VTIVLVNNAVQQIIQLPLFMIASLHRIKLKQYNLAGCNKWNSLHERNKKYVNLNSMKSKLHYYHPHNILQLHLVTSVHE